MVLRIENRSSGSIEVYAIERERGTTAYAPVPFKAGILSDEEWNLAGKYLKERELADLVARVREWNAYVARTDYTSLADTAVGPSIRRWILRARIREIQDSDNIERAVKEAARVLENTHDVASALFGVLRERARAVVRAASGPK